MTLIEEATILLEKLPQTKQRMAIDFLRMISNDLYRSDNTKLKKSTESFRRTGKTNFNLPDDFDDHFDDLNDEIASLFSGDNE